jgi:peptide/nickel transport system substrate-binding protein
MDGRDVLQLSSTAYGCVSRRAFIRAGVLTIAAVPLAVACAPQAPPPSSGQAAPAATPAPPAAAPATAPITAPAKPAETKPAAPAAAQPTTVPAKPAEAAKPAAGKPESKLGANLIGKLEGPTVITDPAQFPKSFKEAPMLAELVKAGTLPPVEERIGQDPLVIKPLHEIGKHGGTWRRGFTGPNDTVNGIRAVQNDKLLYFDYTGTQIVPNVARDWQVSDDGRTTTLFLRRGMRWSDGAPFTADDFIFWFEDIYQNKEIVPSLSLFMTINAKPVTMEKVDTYTVVWKAPDPYFLVPNAFAWGSIGHHARYGRDGMGGFAPAHYLKQFHPKHTDPAQLDQLAKDAKFDNWVSYFKGRNDSARNPDLPVLTAWKTTTPITTPTWTLERNPYAIWVDTDGNQLPYIDKCVMTLGENLEVINLRAIAGEYDEQSRHIDISKLPVLLENQQKGGYTVRLDPDDQGSDVGLYLNQSFDADPEIAMWLQNREFRIALSHGIDRDQINETFVLGLAVTGSAAPGERTLYSPGPEYRTLHSTLDVKRSNEMLDALGLDKRDAEGYRLRKDGQGRLRLEAITYLGFLQFTQILEMVREHWKKIGIDLTVRELERSLQQKRTANNENQIVVETQWGGDDMFGNAMYFPSVPGSDLGPLYGQWFLSGGTRGKEPPLEIRDVMFKFREARGLPEKQRIEAGKEIWRLVLDQVWTICVVGNSPASQGVRVVKNNVGNIPERLWNSALSDNPMIAHPETFFFK